MSIESAGDWAGLKRVGRIVRLTLEALTKEVRPGVTTTELDTVAKGVLRRYGAQSAPAIVYGFPGTVLISVNDEVVHGIPGPRRLERGDVVKLDVTLEKDGYVADAARTVIVEEGSEASRRLVACAEAAFAAGLAVARAGTRVNEVGRAVEREVRGAGFAVIRGLTGHGVGQQRGRQHPALAEAVDQPGQLRSGHCLGDGEPAGHQPGRGIGAGLGVHQPDDAQAGHRDADAAGGSGQEEGGGAGGAQQGAVGRR